MSHTLRLAVFTFVSSLGLSAAVSVTPGASFPTLPGPLAASTADFNGDGNIDLAVSNTAVGSISVFLGNGNGTFKPRVDYPVSGCQPGQTITGDFNRDGKLDLLGTCTLTTSIFVLPGKGDGTFGPPVFSHAPYPIVSGFLESFVQPLSSADINGDGIPDLALIIQTTQTVGLGSAGAVGQAITMTGNGDGTFGHPTTVDIAPAGTEPYEVILADVNGDSKADIVGVAFDYDSAGLAPPYNADLFVALGDGRGGFQLAHSYPLNNAPESGFMVADVNGDGKLDAVLIGLNLSAVLAATGDVSEIAGMAVFLGAGDGSFKESYSEFDPQSSEYQLTVGAALASVEGTEYPDLVTAVLYSGTGDNATVSGAVAVRPNNGDGTFGPPQNITAPSASLPFSIHVADFDNNGSPDILSFNFTQNLFDLLFGDIVGIESNIDAIGSTIATFPTATGSLLLNGAALSTFTDTNAASFTTGPVATSSIVAAFGSGLSATTQSASMLPLPATLGGATVTVTDSAGVARPAPLFYASPAQINYAIPDGTATGRATIAIASGTKTFTVNQSITTVAPGVFDVSGLAVGQVLTYNGSANPITTSTLQSASGGQFTAAPITVSSGMTTVFLVLYGTGLRNHQNAVTATIGNVTLPVAYAGPQGTFVGEDQINVELPSSLSGAGLVNLTLNVDGATANPVMISIQ